MCIIFYLHVYGSFYVDFQRTRCLMVTYRILFSRSAFVWLLFSL